MATGCSHSHKESERRSTIPGVLTFSPSSSKDSLSLSLSLILFLRFPGRGTVPFVSKSKLLFSQPFFFFLPLPLFSLRLIHPAQRGRGSGWEGWETGWQGIFHLDEVEEEKERKDNKQKKRKWKGREREREGLFVSVRPCMRVCVPMFFWPLPVVSAQNDRRVSGWRERLFSLRPCHGKHTLLPSGSDSYTDRDTHKNTHTRCHDETEIGQSEGGKGSNTSVMEQEGPEQLMILERRVDQGW